MRVRTIVLAASCVWAMACAGSRPFITNEGNIAIGPPNAATGSPGETSRVDRTAPAPERHVAHDAFDTYRPPAVGLLPTGMQLHRTSESLELHAGPLTASLRGCDALVPAWGGDTYVRIDLNATGPSPGSPPRDLVVLLDVHETASARRAHRMAAALFETLRGGDHGALVDASTSVRVLVPLLPSGAMPLLVERARDAVAGAGTDGDGALGEAVQLLGGTVQGRIRKVVVFSDARAFVTAETLSWLEAAGAVGADVTYVPLSHRAANSLAVLGTQSSAIVIPEVVPETRAESEAVSELASLPPDEPVADDVSVTVDSTPGPFHLLEVAGARSEWTPGGAEVPLGAVRSGDARTLVLRGMVPPWRAGEDFALAVRVRWRDATGPHEATRTMTAQYTGSARAMADERAGDVLQYVSLLNTLSTVQAAVARHDSAEIASLDAVATRQARTLLAYAAEHHDALLAEQSALLLALLHAPAAALRP